MTIFNIRNLLFTLRQTFASEDNGFKGIFINMQILCTGATGLVGYNFIKAAAEAGHKVTAVCGTRELPQIKNVEALKCDLLDEHATQRLVLDVFPQIIVDCAAISSPTDVDANPELAENDCYTYAAIRNILYRKGKETELLVAYEPCFTMMCEWWKQLFGESEGKDQKGLFPASVDLTTDLHSMGQFIQDGSRIMFETVLNIEKSREEVILNEEPVDLDGLNYLAGKSVDFVNKSAMNGTILAHTDGQVPNLMVKMPEVSEFFLGELFYFFEFACGLSGYLLGVNPFNQPGVEGYKKNMFALLGKPGYEAAREELLKRL